MGHFHGFGPVTHFFLFAPAINFCMGLASQGIMVYRDEKKFSITFICALWKQFYEKIFLRRLEISLDAYIHHFQLNWITYPNLKNWATFMVLGQSDPFLSFYTSNWFMHGVSISGKNGIYLWKKIFNNIYLRSLGAILWEKKLATTRNIVRLLQSSFSDELDNLN